MRKIALTFVGILLFSLSVLAQQNGNSNPAKDSLLNKICDCVSKGQSKKDPSPDDISGALQECMMTIIMEDPLGAMSSMGLEDFSDQEEAQKMGQQIGIELITKCPAMKDLYMKMSKSGVSAPTEKVSSGSIYGKLLGFDTDTYQYLLIEEAEKPTRILLLHGFADSENFWKEVQSMKGKPIILNWKETAVWNMKSKAFEKQREITGWSKY
jgi:hypothetical protein